MCPVNSIRQRTLPQSRISTPWWETTRCVRTIFARCRRTFRPVCANCIKEKSPTERKTYDTIARHYLYAGDISEVEEVCFDCRSRIPSPKPYSSCPVCTAVIGDFGDIAHSWNTSYETPDTVLIVFRQVIKPGIVDPLI